MLLETALAALALQLAAPAAAPPVKPWVAQAGTDCDWWLSGPNGKELHASIGLGDVDPVLSIVEHAFLPFAETDDVPLILRFDRDPKREVAATAWSSSVVKGNERILGLYLRPEARKAMGGASRIEVLHQGKLLADIPLAATPSQAALDACVRPPNSHSEEESGG